jgi:hypothetical protein
MELRRRLVPMLFIGAGAAFYFGLGPRWPTDQHLRVSLGNDAPRVTEVTVRCALDDVRPGDGDPDWVREVTFRYAKGQAPRILSYEPRLASGDYLVEIEEKTDEAGAFTTDRHAHLSGGTTTFDLSRGSEGR